MARGSVTRWAGGYRRKGVYIIRRNIKGRSFEVSTRCTTEAAAIAQLQRFETDPFGYDPSPPAPPGLFITKELVDDFLSWSRKEKANTALWVQNQKTCLAWWADELHQKDLKKLDLVRDIKKPLAKVKGWKHRARVLKAFYGWLRQEEHLVNAAEDPVHGMLRVPSAKPEQWTTPKLISKENLAKVLKRLKDPYRAAVEVLAGTGWHVTELLRFAAAGAIERDRVLLCPQTKGGSPVKRLVSLRTASSARRLLEKHEGLSQNTIIDRLEEASDAARLGKDRVMPGRFRHTFASWAIEHGALPEEVAAALDHKTKATTMRFYATHAVRPKVPAPR